MRQNWACRSLWLSIIVLACVTPHQVRAGGPFFHGRTSTPELENATVGRYLYLGDVPQFEPQDLELYVSKVALTLRVKAWVPSQLPLSYRTQLMARWRRIYDAFQDPVMRFERLRSIEQEANGASDKETRAWLTIAAQYSRHVLEKQGVDIYGEAGDDREYANRILLALARYYLGSPELTLEQVLTRDGSDASDSQGVSSEELFERHLGHLFTRDTSRKGYAGYLTFIYPISATSEGPFDQPREGVVRIGLSGSIESRWWSALWKDEYGGFPFLLVNDSGVAFHGPISNKSGLDNWYLRRGYVSHGCMRMDSSDVMELRALLPQDFPQLADSGRGIRLVIMEWPDVTDSDGDGTPEVMDVAYYEIPPSVGGGPDQTLEDAVAPYLLPQAQRRYWKAHFAGFVNGALRPGLGFDASKALFYGLPRYEVSGERLKRVGRVDEAAIRVFEHRNNRIIQYREQGVRLRGYDDRSGQYPPVYFVRKPRPGSK